MYSSKEKKAEALRKWRRNNKEKVSTDSKNYYQKNKERLKAMSRERYKSGREKNCARSAEHYFKRTYGISKSQILDMAKAQEGKCYICRHKPKGGRDCLHLDHNHKTRKIRKLLCVNCNLGIGHFKDDPRFLKLAILYLEEQGGIE